MKVVALGMTSQPLTLPLARATLLNTLRSAVAGNTFKRPVRKRRKRYKGIVFSQQEFRQIWARCFHSLRVGLLDGKFPELDAAVKKPKLLGKLPGKSNLIGVRFIFPYETERTRLVARICCVFGSLKREVKAWPIMPDDIEKTGAFKVLRLKVDIIERLENKRIKKEGGSGDLRSFHLRELQSFTLRYDVGQGAVFERSSRLSFLNAVHPQFFRGFLRQPLIGVKGIYRDSK